MSLEDKEFVYDGDEKSLVINGNVPDDVLVVYTGNGKVNAGEYEVTITAKGNYTGTITKKWTIKAKQIEELYQEISNLFHKNVKNNIALIELKVTNLYGLITNNETLYLKEYNIPIRSEENDC